MYCSPTSAKFGDAISVVPTPRGITIAVSRVDWFYEAAWEPGIERDRVSDCRVRPRTYAAVYRGRGNRCRACLPNRIKDAVNNGGLRTAAIV